MLIQSDRCSYSWGSKSDLLLSPTVPLVSTVFDLVQRLAIPLAPCPHINRRDTPPGLLPVVVSPYDWCSPLSFTILPPLLGQLADPSFFVSHPRRMPGCASYSIPDGPSERTLRWLRFPVWPGCASFHG